MPHLGFRRDITLNLLHSKPKLISQSRPKIHVPTEFRKIDNHFIKSASQGRCAVCLKKIASTCVLNVTRGCIKPVVPNIMTNKMDKKL
ncbi:hypothetical protein NPIL_197971 [Nephila pilipes]|uniref:Uncharacterized protein n=1 Tax=Nephila pilipes TaxID=299642 RepID=A0A8X6TD84_NEPPI|nr:hypothetical protein NPIL_197971 [Nephila pilipes]